MIVLKKCQFLAETFHSKKARAMPFKNKLINQIFSSFFVKGFYFEKVFKNG